MKISESFSIFGIVIVDAMLVIMRFSDVARSELESIEVEQHAS